MYQTNSLNTSNFYNVSIISIQNTIIKKQPPSSPTTKTSQAKSQESKLPYFWILYKNNRTGNSEARKVTLNQASFYKFRRADFTQK